MTGHARGTFEVKLEPQTPSGAAQAANLARLTLDKQFHGDLEGASKGEMLSCQSGVEGSAGYVAMERISGSLHGRVGTFALQHSGSMNRGAFSLTINVVPDTGTEHLEGLTGKMEIIIRDGKHFYEFDYGIPTAE